MFAGKRPNNLGARNGRLAPCPTKPNCVSSQSDSRLHRIKPLAFSDEPAQAMARLKSIVTNLSGATLVEEKDGYLYFECVTKLLGFVDDLEFLCQPDEGQVAVRSASRLGYSDMGVNRKRVEAVRQEFAHG